LPRDEVMHRHPLPSESHCCNSAGKGVGLARGNSQHRFHASLKQNPGD
jgi:hypothetical protein